MIELIPAIDLIGGQCVRLSQGDYATQKNYGGNPVEWARAFADCGVQRLHLVDLEGAKSGGTDNLATVERLIAESGLLVEIGGGIRSMETVRRYLDAGVSRVILGTAAVSDPEFLKEAADRYGAAIAVGADIRDGEIAIRGWKETSGRTAMEFCREMQAMGIRTLICTDISRDGAMLGTNHELYRQLREALNMDLVASGGVSSIEDVRRLKEQGLYGAIIGKAYYTGAVDLREAIEVAT